MLKDILRKYLPQKEFQGIDDKVENNLSDNKLNIKAYKGLNLVYESDNKTVLEFDNGREINN
jgi:hypothetical protein